MTPSSFARWSGRGLEDEGYRVTEAIDGLAALEQCRRDPPDVILLDVEMPGIDGFQVLRALKSDADSKTFRSSS